MLVLVEQDGEVSATNGRTTLVARKPFVAGVVTDVDGTILLAATVGLEAATVGLEAVAVGLEAAAVGLDVGDVVVEVLDFNPTSRRVTLLVPRLSVFLMTFSVILSKVRMLFCTHKTKTSQGQRKQTNDHKNITRQTQIPAN